MPNVTLCSDGNLGLPKRDLEEPSDHAGDRGDRGLCGHPCDLLGPHPGGLPRMEVPKGSSGGRTNRGATCSAKERPLP